MTRLSFACEPLTPDLLGEMLPLLEAHWREVGHYQDIPLEVDEEAYLNAEASGTLRCFTARAGLGALVGYAVFFVRGNPHYKSSWQAVQDVLYLHPGARGNGAAFVRWCDEWLADEGTEVVYHHVKAAHDFGVMLERQGYELVDKVYAKRLRSRADRPTAREALDEAFI